tara:strand:- start:83 stop:838 length:756 start_codon:yes stop_codon:yes gene_type:complete
MQNKDPGSPVKFNNWAGINPETYHHKICFITNIDESKMDKYDFMKFSHSAIMCDCHGRTSYSGNDRRIFHGWDSYCVTTDKKTYSLLKDIRNEFLVQESGYGAGGGLKSLSKLWIPIFSELEFDKKSVWNYIPDELWKHTGSDMNYDYLPPGQECRYDYIVWFEYGYDIDYKEVREKIIELDIEGYVQNEYKDKFLILDEEKLISEGYSVDNLLYYSKAIVWNMQHSIFQSRVENNNETFDLTWGPGGDYE